MHVVAIRAFDSWEVCRVITSTFQYLIDQSTSLVSSQKRIKARGAGPSTDYSSLSARIVIQGFPDHAVAFFISLICSKAGIILPTVAAVNFEPLSSDYKKLRRTIKLEIKAFESVYAQLQLHDGDLDNLPVVLGARLLRYHDQVFQKRVCSESPKKNDAAPNSRFLLRCWQV